MNSFKFAACAAVALTVSSSAAYAATVETYIDFRGYQGLQSQGEALDFTEGDVTVSATAHILNEDGTIGAPRWLGQYGGGLGVTTYGDTTHEIDSEGGADETVKLSFNREVTLEAVYFTLVDGNDDFAFSVADGEDSGSFYGNLSIGGNGHGSYTFNSDWTATLFGIGAADSTCFGYYGRAYSCDNYDNFKLKGVKVSYNEPEVVPLPAAGWMLIAGIGGLVGMRRRKK